MADSYAEKASIDEAYIDFTPAVIDILLERYPFLSSVPPDAPDGLDTLLPPAPPCQWSEIDNLLPNDAEAERQQRAEGDSDEEYEPPSSSPQSPQQQLRHRAREATPWRDHALAIGSEIMNGVRKEIWKRLHYTTSAGIAHNKAMAKASTSALFFDGPLTQM